MNLLLRKENIAYQPWLRGTVFFFICFPDGKLAGYKRKQHESICAWCNKLLVTPQLNKTPKLFFFPFDIKIKTIIIDSNHFDL